MFYEGDSIYLYIVDFGSEFNGFGFLASDNGEIGRASCRERV